MKKPGVFAKLLLRSLFRKPATLNYPVDKSGMPEGFRGKIQFNPDLCVGCQMCVRDCPSGAITITKAGEKRFIAQVNLGKCIYCGQCVDSCLKKALCITPEFELAAFDPDSLIVTFDAKPKDDTADQA